MAKIIGRRISVGLGKESTRGTAVAIAKWIPKMDMSFDDKYEKVTDTSGIGVIFQDRNSMLSKSWAEGELSGNIEVGSFGYILLALMGSVTTTTAGAGAYNHAFTLNNTNTTQSLTIGIVDPNAGSLAYSLAMVDSLTINAEEGGFCTFSVMFKSKAGASASHTVTYSSDYKLLSRMSIFKVASNLAGLSGATALCIKSFEITINKNLEEDYCLGSQFPADFMNKQTTIEGSFTAVYNDTATYRDVALAGTNKAISFSLIDTATTIGSTNPTLNIDLPIASFEEWNKTQGNDEIVVQTVTFKGLYSTPDSSAMNVTLKNDVASY